jgi:hypothetical protein
MDLEEELNTLIKLRAKVVRKIDNLEDEGHYGSDEHAELVLQELEFDAEIDALQDEIERGLD